MWPELDPEESHSLPVQCWAGTSLSKAVYRVAGVPAGNLGSPPEPQSPNHLRNRNNKTVRTLCSVRIFNHVSISGISRCFPSYDYLKVSGKHYPSMLGPCCLRTCSLWQRAGLFLWHRWSRLFLMGQQDTFSGRYVHACTCVYMRVHMRVLQCPIVMQAMLVC